VILLGKGLSTPFRGHLPIITWARGCPCVFVGIGLSSRGQDVGHVMGMGACMGLGCEPGPGPGLRAWVRAWAASLGPGLGCEPGPGPGLRAWAWAASLGLGTKKA
jgi:hypothetical protein